jgi:hypothetical protein
MRFEEVLPALREGKKVYRKCFGESNWTNMPDITYYLHRFVPKYDAGNMINADDWEIVEEHKRCPGCNCEGLQSRYRNGFIIECAGPIPCFATYPPQPTPELAWAIWDKRA